MFDVLRKSKGADCGEQLLGGSGSLSVTIPRQRIGGMFLRLFVGADRAYDPTPYGET